MSVDPSGVVIAETARTRLVVPPPEAAAAVVTYLRRNREHFQRWSRRAPEERDPEASWRERLASARAELAGGTAVRCFLQPREERSIIGDVTLDNIVRGPFQAAYLGYRIDAAYEGKHLMFEALQALVRYAFEDLKLHRIMANYMPANERSGRLLRRIGFVVEGYARDYLHLDGAWRDHILTSLTNPNPLFPDADGGAGR